MSKPIQTTHVTTDRVSGGFRFVKARVKSALAAGLTPFIQGGPGLGKSTMAMEIAAELNLPLVIKILSHEADPADLLGGKMPGTLTMADGTVVQVLHDCCPQWLEPYYKANKPFVLFLDEVPNSPPHAVTILNSVILERRIGCWQLPKGTLIICAGNRLEDGCMVSPLSKAFVTRTARVTLLPSVEDFTIYSKKAGLNPLIVGYINWKGVTALNDPVADINPRVWAGVNQLMAQLTDEQAKDLTSHVGMLLDNKTSIDLKTFRDVWQAVDYTGIFKGEAPDFSKMEESTKYAISFGLASEINKRYKNPKERKLIDWDLLAKTLLALPASLTTICFLSMDDIPVRDASAKPAFTPFVDLVFKLLMA